MTYNTVIYKPSKDFFLGAASNPNALGSSRLYMWIVYSYDWLVRASFYLFFHFLLLLYFLLGQLSLLLILLCPSQLFLELHLMKMVEPLRS